MLTNKEINLHTVHHCYGKLALLVSVIAILTKPTYAQNDSTRNIETRYLRPTIVSMFSNKCKDEQGAKRASDLFNKFKTISVVGKFDEFKLENRDVNTPAIDEAKEDDGGNDATEDAARALKKKTGMGKLVSFAKSRKRDLKALRKKNRKIDSSIDEHYKAEIKPAAKEAVAKWFNMDENGNCSPETLLEKARKSIIDKDKIIDNNSEVKRSLNLGKDLIDRTYFFVYTVDKVQTKEEEYEENGTADADRTRKGYSAHVNIVVYKLDFRSEQYTEFSEKYYTEKQSHDKSKVNAWKNADYNVQYVTRASFTESSTADIKDNTDLNSLLHSLPEQIQETATDIVTKLDRNLAVKTDIYSTEPLTAKIGIKEDLYTDKRFFVFLKELDLKSNAMKAKRVGVARVLPYYSWDTGEATGDTKPSRFQQQGGKKMYPGFFLEEHEDAGIYIYANYALLASPAREVSYGAGLNLSKTLAQVVRGSFPAFARHIPGGIVFSLTTNMLQGADANEFLDLASDETKYRSRWLHYRFSWDYYFTKKGNFYLTPMIGQLSSRIKVKNSLTTEENQYKGSFTTIGANLGYNLHPYVSVYGGFEGIIGSKFSVGGFVLNTKNGFNPSLNLGVRVNL